MSEWWTYRPSDFLMFSARTWHRLFEQANVAWWPLPLLLPAMGAALLVLAAGRHRRAAAWGLAAAWAFVAWDFFWQRYAEVMTAAPWFAAGFALQALVLAAAPPPPARFGPLAVALAVLALLVWPLLGLAAGRPLAQAQVAGLAPEPTALLTLALLVAWRPAPRWWWPLPLAWCTIGTLTLWTLDEPVPALLLAAAALAALAARGRTPVQGAGRRSPGAPS